MNKTLKTILPLFIFLALILSACGGNTPPAATQPAATDAPLVIVPTETQAVVPPTDTPVPTPDNKMAATPTIPAVIMTPGKAIEEADYIYYEQLMLITGDNRSPIRIDRSYGVNIALETCGTCEMGITTFLDTTQVEKNISITVQLAVFRFASPELVQARIPEENARAEGFGGVQQAVPQGYSLPAETFIFTIDQGGTGVMILSYYEGFEISIAQGTLADMSDDELIAFFCQLMEMQIAKLVAAGY